MKKISEIEAYEEIYPHKLYVNYWTDYWDQCYYGFSANDEKSDPKDDDVVYVRGDLAHPWNVLPKEKPTTNSIYLCTVIDKNDGEENSSVVCLSYDTEKDCWLDLNGDVRKHVVAWQEIPKPYLTNE